jgi:hypothetical protein
MFRDIDVGICKAAVLKLAMALSLQVTSKVRPNLAEPVFLEEIVSN